MRITNAKSYNELRDSVSQEWSSYILETFPNSNFLFIPNIKNKVIDYVRNWSINVLILTGGSDIGKYPDRDLTELLLIDYALKNKIPIIGICRGMQLIHNYFGGKFSEKNSSFSKRHVCNPHLIIYNGKSYKVNSFHNNKIDDTSLDKSFNIFAKCKEDDSTEGFFNKKVLCMMWHPEREKSYHKWNQTLIKNFILNYEN